VTTTSASPDPAATVAEPEVAWHRLSLRMLAVHPVNELIRAIPLVIALLVVGSRQDGGWWAYLGIVAPVVIGLIRWATTYYRITPVQIQVRRGFFGRSVRTVPRDRVRTVDLTSHLMHRLLGLTRVAIGTGQVDRQKDSGLVLDGLSTSAAASLREELLHRRRPSLDTPQATTDPPYPASATAPGGESTVDGPVPVHAATSDPAGTPPGAVPPGSLPGTPSGPVPAGTPAYVPSAMGAPVALAKLDPAWIRYGPFSLSGLVTIGVVAAFAWRTINEAHLRPDQLGPLRDFANQLGKLPLAGAVTEVAVLALLLVAGASTVAYVLGFWNFVLSRTNSATLHVSRGLLTTRSTTIEERRLRGVEISEPLLLRSVGAARCTAITTGLRYGRGAERGGSLLLPPAPLHEAQRVGAQVLGSARPLTAPLVRHSRAAYRRRLNRALLAAAIVVGLAAVLSTMLSQPALVVAVLVVVPASCLWLAKDRFRSLGHTIVDNRMVFALGSVVRRRYVIESDGIIGWKIRQSFFQRRAGLVTLTATTAAGRQHYPLPDVDTATAIELADTVLPNLLTPFLQTPAHRSPESRPRDAGDFGQAAG
jgi:putative membrane protein